MPEKERCNNKYLDLFFWQLETRSTEICFLTTVAWMYLVFTVKPKGIRTYCTNSQEQTVPAPELYLSSRLEKTAAFQWYGREKRNKDIQWLIQHQTGTCCRPRLCSQSLSPLRHWKKQWNKSMHYVWHSFLNHPLLQGKKNLHSCQRKALKEYLSEN